MFDELAKNLYNWSFYLSGQYWVSSLASVNNCLRSSISLVSNIKISSGNGTATNSYKIEI